jgi:hypothetical protein
MWYDRVAWGRCLWMVRSLPIFCFIYLFILVMSQSKWLIEKKKRKEKKVRFTHFEEPSM